MKKLNLLKMTFVLFLSLLLSCETEKYSINPNDGEFLGEAKNWFETEIGNNLKLDSKQILPKSNSGKYDIKLDWEASSILQLDSLSSVELPIYGLLSNNIPVNRSSNTGNSIIDYTQMESYTSFIIQQDKTTQKMRAFFMTVIPDEYYRTLAKIFVILITFQ